MNLTSLAETEDTHTAQRVGRDLAALMRGAVGEPITIANEFSEVIVHRVETRNGSRLLIVSPRSGRWVSLDALEVEALTCQNSHTLAAMVGNMDKPLLSPENTDR